MSRVNRSKEYREAFPEPPDTSAARLGGWARREAERKAFILLQLALAELGVQSLSRAAEIAREDVETMTEIKRKVGYALDEALAL